ncbi:MAG TPA: class I SAM-dependent methyltransferase [Pseudonocardiaceae bacterium]|jgi:SAM-dependent methyltransferase|nr:class I SAM-dependent methyltransferase [Pseudonocardiaceae bacterium]
MDLSTVAVPHTLAHLKPLLPAPPARILEAGCGRGALAAALIELGYQVTGVDRGAKAAAAARERGVPVIEADVNDVSGQYDVVLFTRSLHHAEDLNATLAHAATLLVPGGALIIEEFAWERVDSVAADFLYDNRALLVAADLLDTAIPAGDLLADWIGGHGDLHQGAAMLAAMSRIGTDLTTVDTPMLWRLIDGRGGVWTEPTTRIPGVLDAIRLTEQRRLAAGTLPSVGLLASLRR